MNQKTSILAVMAIFFAVNAHAVECPVKNLGTQPDGSDYVDAVMAIIGKQKTCEKAAEVAEACAFGSAVDGPIVSEALVVCDRNINNQLKVTIKKARSAKDIQAAKLAAARTLKTYSSTRDLCDQKYSYVEGTIRISMTVFCYLDVAKLFTNLTEDASLVFGQ
jgi:hypothetical protein